MNQWLTEFDKIRSQMWVQSAFLLAALAGGFLYLNTSISDTVSTSNAAVLGVQREIALLNTNIVNLNGSVARLTASVDSLLLERP